jgi:GAF domain-containing protein
VGDLTADRWTEQIVAEQAALRRVATLAARAATPEEVFAAVADEVGQTLGADFTVVSKCEADNEQLYVGSWSRTGDTFPVGTRLHRSGQNVVSLVVQTGQPARINDYAGASGPIGESARGWGFRTAVGVPIRVEGQLWGVIAVASRGPEPLPADTETRLAGFTELVATAIANAQARMELRGYADEQAALRRVATLAARAAPPEEVFAAVAEEVGQTLGTDFAILSKREADNEQLSVGSWNRTGGSGPFPVGTRVHRSGQNVVSLVVQTGQPARINDYTDPSDPIGESARGWGFRTAVGVPISVEGQLWGVIAVASRGPEPLPADTETRLAGFTELVATAIANAQARMELRGYADEQAALRRVATLVARAAPPEEVFAAVAKEVGMLFADVAILGRYDPDGSESILGAWSNTGQTPVLVGRRMRLGGHNVSTLVFQTGQPTRVDMHAYSSTTGPVADVAREVDVHASVGVPINVEDRLWGVVVVSTRSDPLPADTEARLAGFTELVGTALANAEAQAALAASRARIVAAADTARRRIERNLHDGAQQRLVSLALRLRTNIRPALPPGADKLSAELNDLDAELNEALDELRELAHGLHPTVLARSGLRSALKSLARRCPVPVRLTVAVDRRPPEHVELAAYYVVAEALTNVTKHARASVVEIEVSTDDNALRARIFDDGRGGANPAAGTGLLGLIDRIEALGGRISLHSPPGAGTAVQISLPLTGPFQPGPPPNPSQPPGIGRTRQQPGR